MRPQHRDSVTMTQSYASDDGEDDDAADELTNVKALNKSRVTTTP